jgi:hypothetical protein
MRASHLVPLLAVILAASACSTTVVDTGREPARITIRDDWVMGFMGGLVMTEGVNVTRRCPDGVARVVTGQSLPNLLVQIGTAGLVSPRSVEVTCAAGPAAERIGRELWLDGEEWMERGRKHRHRHHFHGR